jgi:capsule biosynthesis phosphatase
VIQAENVIVLDLDGTLCEIKKPHQHYRDLVPDLAILEKVREYRAKGFYIIIQTARNMRTHEGNVGRINALTAKTVFEWLDRHEVPYDEVHFGKPWSGKNGFYVDDKAVRPDEFLRLSHEEILRLISHE